MSEENNINDEPQFEDQENVAQKGDDNSDLNDDVNATEMSDESSDGNSDDSSEEKSKTESPEAKYAELNDRFLRLYAEFDNYRRRTNKEKLELIDSAGSGVLKSMLPIMDDFERAMANNEKVDDSQAIKEGITLIYTKLKNTLESKGLKPMNAKGEMFDSELHEAIANVPSPDESLKGKVIEDVEKGYYLNDKVVRFAKVVVGN